MSSDDAPGDDRKVKELLDPATRADLERWFSLPSFDQLAERAEPPRPAPAEPDPQQVAARERRAKALANVDAGFLESIHARRPAESTLIHLPPPLAPRFDGDVSVVDEALLAHAGTLADPREVEIPDPLREDLRVCTPQALLRDLHRPETTFTKSFELIDPAADLRLDASAAALTAMTTRWKIDVPDRTIGQEAYATLRALRVELGQPWAQIQTPRRRVDS